MCFGVLRGGGYSQLICQCKRPGGNWEIFGFNGQGRVSSDIVIMSCLYFEVNGNSHLRSQLVDLVGRVEWKAKDMRYWHAANHCALQS